MTIRRFSTIRFSGSSGPGRESNHYGVSVYRRDKRGILAVYIAATAADAIRLVRALAARYPARLIAVSRVQYTSTWRAPDYAPPIGVPDYRGSRKLSLFTKHGRGHRARWIKRPERPDVLEALAA